MSLFSGRHRKNPSASPSWGSERQPERASRFFASALRPVRRRSVVVADAASTLPVAPVPILVCTELRRSPKLLLRDVHLVAAEPFVVGQEGPGHRVIVFTDPQEATEAHHGVRDLPRALLDHHAFDLSNVVSVRPIDLRLAPLKEISSIPPHRAPNDP